MVQTDSRSALSDLVRLQAAKLSDCPAYSVKSLSENYLNHRY